MTVQTPHRTGGRAARRAARAAPLADHLRPVRAGMSGGTYNPLSPAAMDRIHLAVLDLGLPIMSGKEAFPLLKEARPEMKVILLSGFDSGDAAQELLHAGADAFLAKPFPMTNFGAKLREILDA